MSDMAIVRTLNAFSLWTLLAAKHTPTCATQESGQSAPCSTRWAFHFASARYRINPTPKTHTDATSAAQDPKTLVTDNTPQTTTRISTDRHMRTSRRVHHCPLILNAFLPLLERGHATKSQVETR